MKERIKEDNPKLKRLLVDIPEEMHREVKMRASWRRISMRQWIEIAISERIEEERKYE